MNIGKLSLAGTYLMSDISTIGYTGSANLTLTLDIPEDSSFHSLVNEVLVITNLKNSISIHCDTDWSLNPAVVTLPQKVFEKKGSVWLSIAGHKDDGTIITTNAIRMDVEKSNPIVSFVPESEASVQKQITEAINQYMDKNVTEKLNAIIQKSEDQEAEVRKTVDDFNMKLSTGQLNGAYIFYGEGDPDATLGKINDLYLNTIEDDGQDGGWLYSKTESGWIKVVKLKGESTTKVGGTNFTDAPIKKAWFITDESIMSEDPKVVHIPVITETGNGKLSLFVKTKANLVTLESDKHISNNVLDGLKEEAAYRPKSGKPGIEPEDTHLEFIELTEAEVIAEQRDFETTKDHRLLASVIVHDDLGLDTILTGGVGTLGTRGTTGVADGTDPADLKFAGKYLGYFKDGETPYGIGASCIIEVLPWNNDNFRVIKAYYQHDGTVWMRCMRSGIWTDWKLIAGEVEIYNGAPIPDTGYIDLNYPLAYFGNILAITDGKYTLSAPICSDPKYIMMSGGYSSTSGYCIMTGLFNVSSKPKVEIEAPFHIFSMTGGVTSDPVPLRVVRLIGRP